MDTRKIRSEAETFLSGNGAFHGDFSLESVSRSLQDDLLEGLRVKGASLQMLPTFLSTGEAIPFNEEVLVLDAGGTNFRVARIAFNEAYEPLIKDFVSRPMPGSRGEVSKKEFFAEMARSTAPLIRKKREKIGFCFSYPVEMLPNKDGRLIEFSKEIRASEVIGEAVGAGLLAALTEQGAGGDHAMILLNDTTATQLAGNLRLFERHCEGSMGYILGTGINCSYSERTAEISKLPADQREAAPGERQIINTELGNFGGFPDGTIDRSFRKTTKVPDKYAFEKAVSGKYFGGLVFRALRTAAEEGLFRELKAAELEALGDLSTKDADNFLHNPFAGGNPLVDLFPHSSEKAAEDKLKMFFLVDAFLERGAKLTAGVMAGCIRKMGLGRNPLRPLCLTVEGTTFYTYHRFRARLEAHLRPALNNEFHYVLNRVKEAPLLGAAIAALTNL